MAAAGSRLDALIGVALALGSGLLWGCSDFWGGMISRRIPVLAVSLVSQGIGFVVLGSMFSTLFGARIVSLALLAAAVGITRTSLRQPAAFVAAGRNRGRRRRDRERAVCARRRAWLLALLSVLGSLSPVTTVLLAHVVLGERITGIQRLGVLCAFTGVAFVSAG